MLFIYPTETCYGLGCGFFNENDVRRIYELKRRSEDKPLIVLVNSIKMWKSIAKVDKAALKLAKKFWPGPLTIIQPKRKVVPDIVSSGSIAVRWSSHPVPNKIIEALNEPIVSTSANLSGKKNPYSVKEVPKSIRNGVDEIFDWGKLPRTKPSTVVSVADGKIRVVRSGPIEI